MTAKDNEGNKGKGNGYNKSDDFIEKILFVNMPQNAPKKTK